MAPNIGRNDPCPCGSGRKYKQCCLRESEAAEFKWRQLRLTEGRLIPELWHVALASWGQAGLDEALDTFYAGRTFPVDPEADREFESLFLTWFGLRFSPKRVPRDLAWCGALQLLERDDTLSDVERRFLAECVSRPVSFHHITAVDEGRSIDLEDLLTGEHCRVLERSASKMARRGGVLFARTITVDGVSIMVGCGVTQIPPTYRLDLQDMRTRLAGEATRLTGAQVLALDDVLRRYYLGIAEQIHNPTPPILENTDGDPLVPTSMHFGLLCSPQDALERLRTLNVLQPDDVANEERDETGTLSSFTVEWTKAGNRMHKSWDNPILGRVDVNGRSLSATVNSKRRATRLRKQIEKRLGDRAVLQEVVAESAESMLAHARAEPHSPVEDVAPEVTAEFMRQHWDEWLDTQVPALGHLTPREAAETPDGRTRLLALLDDFEWRADEERSAEVSRLRNQLGL